MIDFFDYQPLVDQLEHDTGLDTDQCYKGAKKIAVVLPELLDSGLCLKRYGDLPRWQQALNNLPDITNVSANLNQSAISLQAMKKLNKDVQNQLYDALKQLMPWRKGPFDFFNVQIDTEWRSDLKWDRLKNKIAPLAGRRVLDVGCGSGYHCWRMAGEGASLVLGIDPTPLFICQYWAVQKYVQHPAVWVVPARMETLPKQTQCFDTVFSMGVLYHRRSPFDHLQELKDALVNGGQLVLETLVIEGDEGDVLVPRGRYAKMGNVWFLPSVVELCNWLQKLNFKNVDVIDLSVTTVEEQRATDWMVFQSLQDFLDPDDSTKTIEGYPAPKRVVITANV